jgi:starch synthase
MKKRNTSIRNIWMVTREYGDLAGAGGVKDVAAQLSQSLAVWTGRRVHVVMPCYGFLDPEARGFIPLHLSGEKDIPSSFEVDMNYAGEERREVIQVWYARVARVHIYLLDSPRFREKRSVYTYTAIEQEIDPLKRQGEGHYDYFAMNLLLQKGVVQLMLLLDERPDIIHCHDGHTAVLPALIQETPWLRSYFRNTGFLVTVHNAGLGYHQEVADLPFARAMTGLPYRVIMASRLGGSFDPLVNASMYALLNTVSENYARELQESDDDAQTGWLGHRLRDLGKMLEGVTNGIDPQVFDPRRGKDLGLAAPFDPLSDQEMRGKQLCKDSLIKELAEETSALQIKKYGFLESNRQCPLFTFIGRLSIQKGVDILYQAVLEMVQRKMDFQLVILGSGTADMEERLISLAEREESRGSICFLSGYDLQLANKVYSSGDFFLVPSRYEPCGLTDFIAQLFGNLPIVHHVGGLIKVEDEFTGFAYTGNSAASLLEAISRAIKTWDEPALIREMQKHAVQRIAERYTWKVVKNHYLKLYKKALAEKTLR